MDNLLEEGISNLTSNLTGAEVVLDENIPFYNAKIPNGGYLHMHRRRIIAFKNPICFLSSMLWNLYRVAISLESDEWQSVHFLTAFSAGRILWAMSMLSLTSVWHSIHLTLLKCNP